MDLKNHQRLGNWPFYFDSFPIFKIGFYGVAYATPMAGLHELYDLRGKKWEEHLAAEKKHAL